MSNKEIKTGDVISLNIKATVREIKDDRITCVYFSQDGELQTAILTHNNLH
tara:strand:+ start:269 stop:421 length:153 start_codon:yes stop_codon:yes gene_type:complete